MLTRIIKTVRWTANWNDTDITNDQWKIEVGGLAISSFLRGCENEINKNSMLIAIPMQVACESPIFTPSRYRALIV